MVLGLLGVGLGAEAAVLALRGGAEALACDSERPFLNVELEPTSPRGRCEGSESWGEAPPGPHGRPRLHPRGRSHELQRRAPVPTPGVPGGPLPSTAQGHSRFMRFHSCWPFLGLAGSL